MLPYKVIVSNKTFNYSGTTESGEASFEFLSLSDAKAFATALVAKYSYAIVYIWGGSGILQYIAVNKNGLVLWSEFDADTQTFPSTGSAEFNGSSDYIQLNDPFSYTNHTIAAWVYANDLTGTSMIFDSREANIDGIILYGSNTETINYQIGNGATSATLTTPSSYLNEWVFISGTYDGTNLKLYANGSIVSSSSTSISVSTAKNARIGGRSYVDPADLLFNGNLANVAIWNRALSSDEINSVMWKGYNELTTSEENGLQSWYSLDSTEAITGDTTADLTFYAEVNNLIFEGAQCVQDALNAFPTSDPGRVLFDAYDTRVIADGGTTEARTCSINEINALL
jgi:hypothetical protein